MRFLNAGDAALVIEFGDQINQETLHQVSALDAAVQQLAKSGKLKGLVETVPTFRSLALMLDPLVTTPAQTASIIKRIEEPSGKDQSSGRHWCMPVHYSGKDAPDLDSLASATGLSQDAIIDLHQSTRYSVYMLGFQPGFAFMGDVDAAIQQPRRTEPRTRVPAGSVAIANQLTAIYPWESPGGWHLIGRCPIPLFDASLNPPALSPGNTQLWRIGAGLDASGKHARWQPDRYACHRMS